MITYLLIIISNYIINSILLLIFLFVNYNFFKLTLLKSLASVDYEIMLIGLNMSEIQVSVKKKAVASVLPIEENLIHISQYVLEENWILNLKNYILQRKKENTIIPGFLKGEAPLHYIEKHFSVAIRNHISLLSWNHKIQDYFFASFHKYPLYMNYSLCLKSVLFEEKSYIFETILDKIEPQKYTSILKISKIKLPQRKKYKDLDKQAESFVAIEQLNYIKKYEYVEINDWVLLDIKLVDHQQKSILSNYSQKFWYQLSKEDIDKNMRLLLEKKKKGDTLHTTINFMQDVFSDDRFVDYMFEINIVDHISSHLFSISRFDKFFGLKNLKETYNKLIEVFSFHHDVSLRRDSSQLILEHIRKFIKIEVPQHKLDEHFEYLLKKLKHNPDYLLYQSKFDFLEKVNKLAKKQMEELYMIDYIGFSEKVDVNEDDIGLFLNLLQRNRLREFIYFDLPEIKQHATSPLIPVSVLYIACKREKTLNLLINHLGK
jgi:FKBP-type peptidyl-prolyl cis-trans isomerase (trigger factor)